MRPNIKELFKFSILLVAKSLAWSYIDDILVSQRYSNSIQTIFYADVYANSMMDLPLSRHLMASEQKRSSMKGKSLASLGFSLWVKGGWLSRNIAFRIGDVMEARHRLLDMGRLHSSLIAF